MCVDFIKKKKKAKEHWKHLLIFVIFLGYLEPSVKHSSGTVRHSNDTDETIKKKQYFAFIFRSYHQ